MVSAVRVTFSATNIIVRSMKQLRTDRVLIRHGGSESRPIKFDISTFRYG